MKLSLPFPPSVNSMYATVKGRRLLTRRGRHYKDEVYGCVLEQLGVFKPLLGKLSVSIEFTPPDHRKRDMDNLFKSLFDALGRANCFIDDSQIKKIYAEMLEPGEGSCTIIIEEN